MCIYLKQIYTISIETGMQNVGIAFMIILLNFPSPEADYAILPLISVSCLTTFPLGIIYCAKLIYNRVNGYKRANQNELEADLKEKSQQQQQENGNKLTTTDSSKL